MRKKLNGYTRGSARVGRHLAKRDPQTNGFIKFGKISQIETSNGRKIALTDSGERVLISKKHRFNPLLWTR